MRAWLLVMTMLSAIAPVAMAQKAVVIYRCTDASGVVTLQNDMACPKGNRQEKRVVEPAASVPFPAAQPAVSTPVGPTRPPMAPAATPAPEPADVQSPVLPLPQAQTPPGERLPPPPLYQCNTADNDSYLSDTTEPKPRCVRVDTVGIDGSQQLGAGQACTMVYDQCQRVPDGAACDAWRKRVNEAQAAWTFARADSSAELKAEYERIARVVAETTCNR